MGFLTFRGGIDVPHGKEATEKLPIVDCPPPQRVFLSMRQHIGAPAQAVVKVGDEIKIGQLVGKAGGFVSANIHSSVSGIVKRISTKKIMGTDAVLVEIENDFQESLHEDVKARGNLDALEPGEIRKLLGESGIVGMGGAGFPIHVKLSPPENKPIDVLIINGAECEPYLTGDHRLMLENGKEIVQGTKLIMKSLGVSKAFIAIEANKPDAILAMKEHTKNEQDIEVVSLKTKYPQGAEKQLIFACTGRYVPSGGLPMDVGVVVNNTASTKAVADFILRGMPLVDRVCTVTGSGITSPMNVKIKNGTPLSHIVEVAKGVTPDFAKLILGGPMMGMAAPDMDMPSTKTTGGLLFLNSEDAYIPESEPCIKCGKCVDICPVFLEPIYIARYAEKGYFGKADELGALDCIECGSCSFICPSKRPLVHSIRMAKRKILESRKK
ncbi:MAG: electron transport complex subunit RsxC [Tissierellia bacterium]|nr:electron transport complex subunit RsxC [Tissierellia bacterium]